MSNKCGCFPVCYAIHPKTPEEEKRRQQTIAKVNRIILFSYLDALVENQEEINKFHEEEDDEWDEATRKSKAHDLGCHMVEIRERFTDHEINISNSEINKLIQELLTPQGE